MENKDKIESIEISVALDNKDIPQNMKWRASNLEKNEWNECKAFLLSLWDAKKMNTLSLNLWTQDLPIHEMNLLFYQTFKQLAETFESSTQNKRVGKIIHNFCEEFSKEIQQDYNKEN